MKKTLIYSGMVFALLIGTIACKKQIDKDDFRAPLIGKYVCSVSAFNIDFDCYDKDLVRSMVVVQEVNFVNDSELVMKPTVSLQYDINTLPYDTVEYVVMAGTGGMNDAFYGFDNYYLHQHSSEHRVCYLAISEDSFKMDVFEGCYYHYFIKGKKAK